MQPHRFAPIVALAAFLGVFALPYAYYQFLHILVCSWAIWALTASWQLDKGPARWLLIALALLFNPIHPAHFTKTVWIGLNIATGLILLWYSYRSRRQPG
jgi:hypothetical protein